MDLSFLQKKVIGVTGGIGAGKSTVLEYIKNNFPVTVLSADDIGKELMEPGQLVYEALVEHYGVSILAGSQIDREKLAKIALATPESVQEINEIEHPIIRQEIQLRIMQAPTRIVFLEAALLAEGGLIPLCDEVMVVDAKEEIRIKRLMTGRGYSEEKCKSFMARQRNREDFKLLASVIIENNDDFEQTKQQINDFITKME